MKTTDEAAKEQGVTERRMRALCADGRVVGAQLKGGTWILPDKVVVLAAGRSRPGIIEMKKPKKTQPRKK
jgi:hypothetical protein